MTDFFKSWILSLSGVIVFGSMCEMILPSGAYKKYIHLAIGLMLILTALTPFTKDRTYTELEIPDGAGEYTSRISAEERQNEDIIRIYKQKLCEGMKEELGGGDIEIECEICEEDEAFGSIERVRIKADGELDSDAAERLKEKYGLSDDKITVEYSSRGDTYGT